MKKIRLSIISSLFALSFLAYTPAKADDQEGSGYSYSNSYGNDNSKNDKGNNKNNGGDKNDNSGGGSTGLPINNGVWFLLAAGAVIGCKVIMNKNKEIKAI